MPTKQQRKVLIVDDDSIIRKELVKELKRNFFSTLNTGSGKEALEILKSNEKIDILLLDVKLPDIDGLEILTEVNKHHSDCEVIVITGHGSMDIAIQSLRRGATDYIEKPIKIDDLSAALGRALEKLAEKEELSYQNTLLVIDDEEIIAEKMKRFLVREGFNVFTAYSGKAGLDIVEKNKIDVIISDIKMAGMDGIEVLTRAKKYFSDIEVIMVTAFQSEELSIKALRAGAFDYITKPVNLDELLFSVKRALETISLNRTKLYRNRELKISSTIIAKMNEELERKIEERTKELSQIQGQLFQTSKLATLGEMATGLAHEINQPLGGIALVAKTFRKLLEREKLTDDEIIEGLDDIEISIERMNRIIKHIRTFARQDTLKSFQVNINETVNSSLTLLDEQLRLHQIEVVKSLSKDLPKIAGEPFQLEQVWINLLSNARHALDEKEKQIADGKINAADFRKRITISTIFNNETNSVCVTFRDNGIGMDDRVKQRVFEPFFTTKEVGQGTGLGLSIGYGIIESHKGKIEVESQVEVGTKITVILPVN